MTNTIAAKPKLSFRRQTLYALGALVAAVALPQLFHVLGAVSGLGTSLGEVFLPMHLPIILVGLLAGPFAGAVSGFLAPLVSFAITGMPDAAMLPFMMAELCVYGLTAGLLRHIRLPSLVKVLIAQIAGRLVRAAAILIAVYGFGSTMNVSTIWTSLSVGLFGLLLQWVLIPLILYRLEVPKHGK